MPKSKYDFGGYATKNNLKCTDGRIILKDAFKDNDGQKVPLVWQHMHNDPSNVLGHAILENREDGVYAYCSFNDTEAAKDAKLLVSHGDIDSLSIYANNLVEKGKNVAHGVIREVSLVLARANPGALIDFISISHADGSITDLDDEAVIYAGSNLELPTVEKEEPVKHADDKGDETVGEVFNTLTEKQKTAVYAVISEIIDGLSDDEGDAQHSDDEGEEGTMKHNVFDSQDDNAKQPAITREQFNAIVENAKKCGSFKEAFLAHAGTYGIDNIEYLFPDAQLVNGPTLIKRDTGWVAGVINGTYHTPFSRIKTVHADITADAARALGYVTGALKKEEIIRLLKRVTTPTTVYKKQKLDRDDIIDITDMDVVAWLKAEMRLMLDEELARAVLVSDGRDPADPDKINEENIRPIWKDDDMYAHKVLINFDADANDIIDEIVRARVNYKGSGDPTLYTTSEILSDMLLLKDTLGRRIYTTLSELASALRVKDIVEVPVMEGLSRVIEEPVPMPVNLIAILVNLRDYSLGADKGGQVSMFDDFDIDYNQYKYLMETRCSGALTLPKSALIFEQVAIPGPE